MGLLKTNGVINNLLLSLGVIDQPLVLMQTDFAVYVGIVYSYLPFMILPLYANLEKMDLTLLEVRRFENGAVQHRFAPRHDSAIVGPIVAGGTHVAGPI
jgi:ABC-type sugar transport system permease subunit